MLFCDVCENMLYHKDGKIMVCRSCNLETEPANLNTFVSRREISQKSKSSSVNKYTKYDPTLKFIHLPCPNEKCDNHKTVQKRIKAVRYDSESLATKYICFDCDKVWE